MVLGAFGCMNTADLKKKVDANIVLDMFIIKVNILKIIAMLDSPSNVYIR